MGDWHRPGGVGPESRPGKMVLSLLVLIVAVGGLALLTLKYVKVREQAGQVVAGASPASTVAPSATGTPMGTPAVQGRTTPSGPSGVGGPQANTATSTPTPTLTPVVGGPEGRSASTPADQTLLAFRRAQVPVRDLYSITARLKLKTTQPIARDTGKPPGNYAVGHTDVFYISDITEKSYYTVTATLRRVTDHAYWYVQDGSTVDGEALAQAARAFEEKIYPTDRALFGSEWTPGVDNDPRITVLFAPISGAGGYYSSADEYTRAVNPYSNEREMIYINIGNGWHGIESTLAHEFQHMIHWHERPNHDVWLNEGCAVLASAVNGYEVLGVDEDFMDDADVQLTAWQFSPGAARANYGAAFLFMDFVRAQFGGDRTLQAVVGAVGQGPDAVDNALKSVGRKEQFEDVFERWVVANLVDGQPGAVAQGLEYPDRQVRVSPEKVIRQYPLHYSGQVSQFGADYIELGPPPGGSARVQVSFSGQEETQVIATRAHSGQAIWYSNRGDVSDPRMTRRFDLRGVRSATLDFYVWFDIEKDLDYGYVEASTDGGATWNTLKGRYTTSTNPNGTNYGNGYTGQSEGTEGADEDGWLHERIDLSAYAGKEVLVRFEYITDDGYNAQGMAVDDISIPEIGYRDDAEGDTGWQAEGFVRIANVLPQRYYLAVVRFAKGGFDVQEVDVGPDGQATFSVEGWAGAGPYDRAVLIVAGMTRYTLQRAAYELSIRPAP